MHCHLPQDMCVSLLFSCNLQPHLHLLVGWRGEGPLVGGAGAELVLPRTLQPQQPTTQQWKAAGQRRAIATVSSTTALLSDVGVASLCVWNNCYWQSRQHRATPTHLQRCRSPGCSQAGPPDLWLQAVTATVTPFATTCYMTTTCYLKSCRGSP